MREASLETMCHFLRAVICLIALSLPAISTASLRFRAMRQDARAQPDQSAARKYFTDTPLVDQDGRSVKFYSDLLQGKVVVINSFFSSCTDSCPAMSGTLARIQEWLGDRLGRQAFIVSITVDPANDTPQVLKEYALRFKARPGWSFVTGKSEDVELVLKKLGQYVDAREDHLNIFIIGNERTGLWKKTFALARPADIIEVLDSVLADKS